MGSAAPSVTTGLSNRITLSGSVSAADPADGTLPGRGVGGHVGTADVPHSYFGGRLWELARRSAADEAAG
jgi:hypothetical protein